ncbi:MAG: LPD38 domain-containing protein [Symbiobacteriia bacterium]
MATKKLKPVNWDLLASDLGVVPDWAWQDLRQPAPATAPASVRTAPPVDWGRLANDLGATRGQASSGNEQTALAAARLSGQRYQGMANAGALNAQYTVPQPTPKPSFLSNLLGGGQPAAPSVSAPRPNSGQPAGSYWEQALAAKGYPMVPTTKGRMTADYLKRAREVLSKTVPYAALTGNNPRVLAQTTVQAAAGQEVAPQQPGLLRNAYLGTQGMASGATFGLVQQDQGRTSLERGVQTAGSFVGAALPWEGAFRYVGAPAAAAATPIGEAAGNVAARLAARLGAREGVQQGTKALTGFFTREAARGATAATAATLPTLVTEPAKTPLEAVKRVGGAVLNSVGFSVGLPLVGEAVSRFGARPIARVIGDRLRTFVPTGEAVTGPEMDLASAGYRFLKGRGSVPGLWVKQEPATGLHYGVRVERRITPEGSVETTYQTFQEAPRGAKAVPQAAEAGRRVIDVTAQPARETAAAQTAMPEPVPGPSPNVPAQPEPGQPAAVPTVSPGVPAAQGPATVTNENPITFAGYVRGGAKEHAPDLVKEAERRNKETLKETGKPGTFQVMLATTKDGHKLYVISSSGEAGAAPAAHWRELPQTGSGYDHLYVPEAPVSPAQAEVGQPAPGPSSQQEPWQMTRAEYEGVASPAPEHFAGTKYPETVYHGSGADNIEQFFTTPKALAGNTGAKTARLGAFFSEDPTISSMAAYGFRGGNAFDSKRKLTLYEAHVNMKNPLEANNLTEKQVGELDQRMPGFKASFEKAKAKGEMFGVVQFLSHVREPKPEVGNFSEWAAQHGIPEADVDRLWKENAPAFQEWRRAFDEYWASATEPAASRVLQEMGYDGIVVKTMMDSGPSLGPKNQYIVFRPEDIAISRKYPVVEHRQWVEYALKEGKPVPPEVLKDYPDLKSVAAQTAQPSALQVSWEATPGKSAGFLPGIHDATPEQKAEYLGAMVKALTNEDGSDAVAQAVGLPVERRTVTPGYWGGTSEPSVQVNVSVNETPESVRPKLEAYAATIGKLLRQEAVGFHFSGPAPDLASANAANISVGRPLTVDETIRLGDILTSQMGEGNFALVGTRDGAHILNLREDLPGDRLSGIAVKASDAVFGHTDVTPEVSAFRADGGLIENDWGASPNGEGYLQRLSAAGRSDVQDGVNLHLAPKAEAVNHDFAQRYGWDRPAGGGESGSGPAEPGGPAAGAAAPLTTTETPDVSRPSAQEQGGGSVSPSAEPGRFQPGEQVRVKGLSGTYTVVADEGKKTVKLQAERGDTLVPRGRTLFPARNSVERAGGASEAAATAEGSGGTQAFAGARPERSVPEGPAPLQPLQRKALIARLSKKFDVTLAKGHFNEKAIGIYKVQPEVIRLRAWGDLQTLAHEIGHHLDKQLGLDRLGGDAELLKLGSKATTKTDPATVRKEGVAEFFRLYLGDPAEAQRKAPGYYAAFEQRLESEPDLAKTIAEAQDQFRAYFAGSARDRVDAAISWNNKKAPIGQRIRSLPETATQVANGMVDEWLDSNAAVRRIQEKIAGKGELPVEMDAYLRLNVLPKLIPGRTEARLRQWQQAMEPLGANAEDYLVYADARAVLHRAGKFGYGDEKLPFSKADAEQIIRDAEAGPQADLFRQTFSHEQQMFHEALQELKDAGVLDAEAIKHIEGAHEDYVPLFRDVEGNNRSRTAGAGRTTVNLPKGVLRQHGGGEPLLDPVERRVRYFARITGIAERNRVGVALAKFAETFGGAGELMDEVPPPMEKVKVQAGDIAVTKAKRETAQATIADIETVGAGDNPLDPTDTISFFRPKWASGKNDTIVTVYRDGKPVYYDVHDPGVLRAIATVDPVTANLATKLTGIVRVGATITPSFSIANLVRDTFESFALSKHQVVPGQALFEAMRLAADKDPFIQRTIDAGLKQGGWLRPEQQSAKMFEQIATGKQATLTPRGLWRLYQEVREQPEFWTRLGEASLEYKSRLKAGAGDEEAFLRALYEGGRITLNFTRGGYTARQINRYVPFFKIPFEAAYRVGEAATEHPGVFLAKLLPFVAAGVATAVLNQQNKQYDEASNYERDNYMLLPMGKALVRVPKANGVFGVIQNVAERAMYQWKTDDPHAWDEFAKDALAQLTPRVDNPALELIVAAATGQSLDSDFPILTESDKNLPKPMQYDNKTSLLARGLAAPFGASPKMVQHGIETVIPGYSQGLFGLENFLRRQTGVGGSKPAAARPENLPVVGRFVSRPGEGKQGRSISVFYDERAQADTAYSGVKNTVERGVGWPEGASYTATDTGVKAKGKFTPAQFQALQAELARLRKENPDQFKLIARRPTYNKVAGMLSDLRRKRKEAEESATLSPDAKRRAIEGFNLQMTNLVRKAYGKEDMTIGQ